MKNICRPFTLYSDFLPPARECRKWDYLAFGYFDGVNVGRNLFTDSGWDFGKMWQYSEEEKNCLDGSYTEQTIFGFRTEDEGEEEAQFWENAENESFPFLFLILLQDDSDNSDFLEGWLEHKRLEEKLSANEGVCAISYLTLDSSDMLLVLACNEYSAGAKLIDSFHTGDGNSVLCESGLNLRYSYTIPAIRKSFLNDSDKISKLKGTVDSAYIHIIEKHPGSIENVFGQIKEAWPEPEKHEKKAVLGCNDDLIVMKGVPWSLFLKFYQDNTGLLNHSYCVYYNNIIGVTTILGEEENGRCIKNDGADPDNITTISEGLREVCTKTAFDRGSGRGRAVRKELLSVLNSLEKYEKSPFHDYIFLSALKPMKLLIEMIVEADSQRDEDKYGYFYDFLTSFNMYTQNSVRSDRQFTEVPDFNIRIYETPVKMNALYNAVIYDLKLFLNGFTAEGEEKHEYEFLTCPGVTDDMQVREIYPGLIANKRLFLVDMPEKQVYSPKLMFTMLAHEISHFVGRGIRHRKYRYECVVKMASDAVVWFLSLKLSEYIKDERHLREITQVDEGGNYWEILQNEIGRQLRQYMEGEHSDAFIDIRFDPDSMEEGDREWWKEQLEAYSYHSDMMVELMADHLCWIFRQKDLFSYLYKKEYIYQLKKGNEEQAGKEEKELRQNIENWVWLFFESSIWNPSEPSFYSIMENLMYLLKESFADLGAVMILKLSVREYLEAILSSANDQGINIKTLVNQEEGIVRGALVCLCMVNDEEDCPQRWSMDEIFDITQETGEIAELTAALWEAIRIYIEENEKEPWETQGEGKIFYYGSVWESALRYLVECRKIFISRLKESMKPIQNGILDMFNTFSEESVEQVILNVRKYIGVYIRNLEKDLNKCKMDKGEGNTGE